MTWTYAGTADYFLLYYRDKTKPAYSRLIVPGSLRKSTVPNCVIGANYLFGVMVLSKGKTSALFAYKVK